MDTLQVAVKSTLAGKTVMMSSTLVETVSINYEDFSESFLTCSTCLCTYDGAEHTPKLLHCSHTVCLHCLSRIVAAAQTRGSAESEQPSSFRCPICRDVIQVPRGGVGALPPSFLVNQLLDLMAQLRREVVPKCAIHSAQELLFCESCDSVFCPRCTSGIHGTNTNSTNSDGSCFGDHTVVPFSIAIKRMSEILLYKANEVLAKLTLAEDNVNEEIGKLELSTASAVDKVNDLFADLEKTLKTAKDSAIQLVRSKRDEKKKILREQLELVQNERAQVEGEVNGLRYQVEVRSLSDRIAALQEKLESVSALVEPRENSYLVYEANSDRLKLLEDLEQILSDIGHPKTSTALPSLCTINTRSCEKEFVNHIADFFELEAVDYHGCPKQTGGDPFEVSVHNQFGQVPGRVVDLGNGSYRVWFRPELAGRYTIRASLFERKIRNSPCYIDVVDVHNPIASLGCRGSADNQFNQPTAMAVLNTPGNCNTKTIYVLDSGNQRIALYSPTLELKGYIVSGALEGRSATGMCPGSSESSSLWVVNWRSKTAMEISATDGKILRSVGQNLFVEPVDVSMNSQGHLLVADAAQGTVFTLNLANGSQAPSVIFQCGSAGSGEGQFAPNGLRSIVNAAGDDIVAADAYRIQIFTAKGQFQKCLTPTLNKGKGQFGGLAYDGDDMLLASYHDVDKTRGVCNGVFVYKYSSRILLMDIESPDSKLKRPGRLCCLRQLLHDQESDRESSEPSSWQTGWLYVTDLGPDCIKTYRYL